MLQAVNKDFCLEEFGEFPLLHEWGFRVHDDGDGGYGVLHEGDLLLATDDRRMLLCYLQGAAQGILLARAKQKEVEGNESSQEEVG